MRLFRLFKLLDGLRGRTQPVTAQQLAEECEVSPRSIYRDIADLQAMGAPIRGEGGVGYVLERGYFLPSLQFDEDELDALMLGLRLVDERASSELAQASNRALSKLSSAIGEDMRESWLHTPLNAGPSRVGAQTRESPFYAEIRAAVKEKRVLKFTYDNARGERSVRLAWPLGMTVFESGWLLTIWCERAEDFRHLRLDRIVTLEPTTRHFQSERGKRFSDSVAREKARMAGS